MRRQIQRKLLIEIKAIYQNLRPESNEELVHQLNIIKNTFKEELSDERYKFYAELLDGITLAVMQFSQQIDESTRNEMFNLSRDLLKYVFNELIKEKGIKKDIVFLPYKASMWDSLESIWQAAYEDKERCNAYVIPIPYAERKPDQSVAAWRWEIDQYPKYVPVLDYRKIDLKAMHPDIIFIHNPYDNYNALTSVDSQYYSDELKKCTDKLVYVPYFVAHEIKPGDLEREEYISNLITTQGVLNADLVVVQSENIRQVYINVLLRYTTQKDRKYWEERIVGLGSPKYDKIRAISKEDIDIPEEWLKVIQRPNKTWKEVVFFNTGLASALSNKENLLDKVEDDLRIFKENKDDIALLWRPHPLVSATMAGMLPELQERYDSIVNKYKEEGWGIFDDTSDLNRSLALSDAYFGDGSSVLELYETTAKPIMHHSIQIFGESNKLFKIGNAYYEDDQIWCTMFHDPYLYRIDLKSNELKEVVPILNENNELQSFINIGLHKNLFIFVQALTNELILMDRNTFVKQKYKIPSENEIKARMNAKTANLLIHNDDLYIFGFDYIGIVKFNFSSKQFTIIDKFLSELEIRNYNEVFCLYDYIKVDEKIFLPVANSNAVIELSLNNDSTTIHYVGNEQQRYISGAWDGENIWLAPRDVLNGDIVKWNPTNNSVKQYKNPLIDEKYKYKGSFDKALKIGNSIIILSSTGINNNIKINIDTEEIVVFDDFSDCKFYLGNKYSCLHLEDDNLFYIYDQNLFKYNFETEELKVTKLKFENMNQHVRDGLRFIFKPKYNGNSAIINEQQKLNLHHLIEFLKLE